MYLSRIDLNLLVYLFLRLTCHCDAMLSKPQNSDNLAL